MAVASPVGQKLEVTYAVIHVTWCEDIAHQEAVVHEHDDAGDNEEHDQESPK